MKYDHQRIEKKWQKAWEENNIFHSEIDANKEKFYSLVEFPYPSGQGLHVGHLRPYTAMDVISRKKRMEGYNVLFPIGWDAFGLPTENYAIKNHIHPELVTKKNVAHFTRQLKELGYSFDWEREINTSDPEYYKWTQWIFIQLYKHGLAYKKEMSVNFCTSCKVVLANEEVVNGKCERCGGEVIRKVKSQWMLKITAYAQRLIDDLLPLDFLEKIKTQEINWIGRSEGAEVIFQTSSEDEIAVYTTRPDTLFGVTYMVMSPEHELLKKWENIITNNEELKEYQELASLKSDFERTEIAKEKTGVKLDGIYAINPVNNSKIPIYISDYVLSSYGTGAIMAVPAHDTRDWEFAKKFELPIIEVISGGNVSESAYTDISDGKLVNSDFLNGLSVEEAKKKIISWLEERNIGKKKINYKLRDWVFSRQRYWGEPVPMVYCEHCGWQPISESELPLLLPEVESYEPTDTGESPLSKISSFVNTTCPKCGGPARRETDTMPNWAGSSWYFLRYTDPHNSDCLASKKAIDYWMPVDWYNGGMEHVTLHLLYSRFWAKFLYDLDIIKCKEPYLKRTAHGMILGEDGSKMSKSRGNVVDPEPVAQMYGADTLRLYVMFIGDFEKSAPWKNKDILGCRRFIERVWKLQDVVSGSGCSENLVESFDQTIKKVTSDIESMKFNTAIASLMNLSNTIYKNKKLTVDELKVFVKLLSPFAPHICEEIWHNLGETTFVSQSKWPVVSGTSMQKTGAIIAVQINGKLRGRISIDVAESEEDIVRKIRMDNKFSSSIENRELIKTIYVPGKIINILLR